MFDIRFTATEPEPQDGDWFGLDGEVIFGEYAESFVAPMGPWARVDYERQWSDAAARLLAGAESSAFFTSAFRFWWAAWRVGDELVVQEEFLTPERLAALGPRPDLRRAPYELLGPLETETEDGERISEWRVPFADVATFLERHSRRTVG